MVGWEEYQGLRCKEMSFFFDFTGNNNHLCFQTGTQYSTFSKIMQVNFAMQIHYSIIYSLRLYKVFDAFKHIRNRLFSK